MEILHPRKRLQNSMTLNASSYHRSDYFCWQTDSYFTTSLCLNGLLHFKSPTHTHACTQLNPTLHRFSVFIMLFMISFNDARVEGEHVQDVMRQCWWVLVNLKEEGRECKKEDRKERDVQIKEEGWKTWWKLNMKRDFEQTESSSLESWNSHIWQQMPF